MCVCSAAIMRASSRIWISAPLHNEAIRERELINSAPRTVIGFAGGNARGREKKLHNARLASCAGDKPRKRSRVDGYFLGTFFFCHPRPGSECAMVAAVELALIEPAHGVRAFFFKG